jgi:hypothetical protein
VQKYVLSAKEKYASAAVRASVQDKKLVGGIVTKWVSGAPLHAANLYFVLASSETVPSWIANDATASKLFVSGDRDLKACLAARLSAAPQSQVGKIQESGLAKSVENFLIAAGTAAEQVLIDCGQKKKVEASIATNDQGGPAAPMAPGFSPSGGPGAPGDPLAGNQTYGFNDLYVNGAFVGNVSNGKDGYRTLSAKKYSNVVNGAIVEQMGITDITNPGNSYEATYVNLPLQGKTTVTIYGSKPDGSFITRSYDLVEINGQITISRPGTKDGQGQSMTFGAADLNAARAKQAGQQGTTMINGKPYFVLGQGGAKGTFLFFDASKNPPADAPDYVSDGITIKDQSGNWGRAQGKPNLNAAHPDPANPWHLEWQNGHWTVVAGQGDVPAAPPSTSSGTVSGASSGTLSAASNPNAGPSASAPCGNVSCHPFTDAYTKRDAAADLTGTFQSQVRIFVSDSNKTDFFLIFPQSMLSGTNIPELSASNPALKGLVGVRGFKDSLVLETQNGGNLTVQYQSIQGLLDVFNKKSKSNSINGSYDSGNDTISHVTDLDVATDIIANYVPAVKDAKGKTASKDSAVAAIKKCAAPFTSGGYKVGGTLTIANAPLEIFADGNKNQYLWPTCAQDKSGAAPQPGDASLTGQGAVVDVPTGAVTTATTGLPASGQTFNDGVLDQKAASGSSIGLYQSETSKSWYVFIQVALDDNTVGRYGPIKLDGVIGQWMTKGGVSLQGLDHASPPLNKNAPAVIGFVGGDATRGVYAAYRFGQTAQDGSNVRSKPGNCAGPVIWFGMTQAQAQAACVAGKL